MRKWLLIYLVLNLLAIHLPKEYAISLFKLGNLLVHFHQHQHESAEHNFFHFLADHYARHEHHDADHENHKNLPFHHHQGDSTISALALVFFFTPPNLEKPLFLNGAQIAVVQNFSDQDWLPSHAPGDIWQPPKA
ncbi:MAG: hypothetical protein IPO07_08480 [Haliscomenobacter sp.]|nr:hypothetical protein [Haliscomenobacter sp.]MBK9488816.1 hypothetical protein [Haliscomenobacter sp.]